ncbi:MAG TPA: right-handed parallel beta-helix repeat-containing protein [Phycisphaerales bacterium]|nr:right-handed parallel beta-helix repeat-containing protein [Phycisphaerales bacterium]
MATSSAQAQTLQLHVDISNGSTSGDGLAWGSAKKYIQDALDEADAWLDINQQGIVHIHVAAGIYRPDQGSGYTLGDRAASFQLRNNVHLYGGYDGTGMTPRNWVSNPTILSGDLDEDDERNELVSGPQYWLSPANYDENSHHVVLAENVTESAVLDGFIIEGGSSYLDGLDSLGGGGMLAIDAAPIVRNCFFRWNLGPVTPGAGLNAGGAGIHVRASTSMAAPIRIEHTRFESNLVWKGGGAGLYAGPSTFVVAIGCDFYHNQVTVVTDEPGDPPPAKNGGAGVRVESEEAYFVNCSFRDNQITEDAIVADTAAGFEAKYAGDLYFWNCLFARNRSYDTSGHGGLYLSADRVEMVNCTIADNQGADSNHAGGFYCPFELDELVVHNSIVWGNSGTDAMVFANTNNTITHSNVQDSGWSGNGNISVDPEFVYPLTYDYRIRATSDCVDAGDNDVLPCDYFDISPTSLGLPDATCPNEQKIPVDLAWIARVIGGTVDMGAYENDD